MDTNNDNKVSFLRHRSSKLKKVKELDAFPKVQDTYVKTSPVGGTCKLIILQYGRCTQY